MSTLFEEEEFSELPNTILGIELDRIEAIVLKTLTLISYPFSITDTKYNLERILASVWPCSTIKRPSISRSIDQLQAKNLLVLFNSGLWVDIDAAAKILPLAKENLPLVKGISIYFEGTYSFHRKAIPIHLAILTRDFAKLDELISVSKSYTWHSAEYSIRSALVRIKDMTAIIPFLSGFHKLRRDLLLNTLPFSLHYEDFEQLKPIYLNNTVKVDIYSKYVYASCAHLILPVNEVLEITKALKISENSLFFSKLLKGKTEEAVLQAAAFLTEIQEQEGHRRKELPGVFGILYAIMLLSYGGLESFKTAATFIRNSLKHLPKEADVSNPFISFGQIILLFINHKLGKETTTAGEITFYYEKDFHQYFLTAVLKWFDRPLKNTEFPNDVNEKEEFEYRAAGLKPSREFVREQEKRLNELRNKFDMIPLAELYKPDEVWEEVLTILADEISKKNDSKVAGKTPEKRLIWLVDPLEAGRLYCLEQTNKKSGWSKGKERSLTRMISANPDFATKQDRDVLSCIQKHDYYNEPYIKDWFKLLQNLAVHPEVYTLVEPHLPLTIRIQEAHIQIDKDKKGASIKLHPKSPDERVIMETPTSYIYIHWSDKALKIFNILSENKLSEIAIPESGMEKAKPVIDRLGEVMPVLGNLAQNTGKKKKSANIPVFQLTPVNDQLHIQLLIEVLKDEDARFVPGLGSAEVPVKNAQGQNFNIVRDRKLEKDILLDLAERIEWLQEMKSNSAQLFLDNEEDILGFLADVKEHAPEVKMIWPKGERLRVAKVISHSDFRIGVKKSQDWFAIDGEIVIDKDLKLSIQQLLDLSKGGILKYIQLDDKTYLSIRSDLQKRLAALNGITHQKGKNLLAHPLGSGSIEKFLEGIENVITDKSWKQHLKNLECLKSYTPSLPNNLKAELRPYQKEGVLWLDRLHHWGVGACLADDMGLGKTIQGMSIMLKYAKNGPSLVLAPASVCNNWIKELNRFAPTLNPMELKFHNREEALLKLGQHDVLVVSYGIVQSNPDLLEKQDWNIVVLDEAQAIKNAKSVRSKAVMKLNAKFKLITTGTPIQNHLGELWNLFQFINPGMLGSKEQFAKKFVNNGDASQINQSRKELNRYISPFILRRNKNEVLDDLPDKTEVTLQVQLSEQERAMYEVLRQEAIAQIASSTVQSGAKHLQILAEITKLRQMSCHPQLLVPDSNIPSSKLEALETLVDDLLDANHKALVFSQFTKHLSLIRTMLDKKGISYQYLDGSTPLKNREKAIDNFQNGKSDLFLISLKAGGVGLNLTAADYVIHMDPWWNPAVEDQASDRAHRIGQTRPVTIYRIIAENTIEEKIVKMHHEKRDLADKLLHGTDQSAKISSEELLELITEQN
ncbi:MAG: DEAD/DEAH box helicase [Bacteroidales bacterium]|nr:DEAD/DEAH box helicase [Bacteroidales bacterium]